MTEFEHRRESVIGSDSLQRRVIAWPAKCFNAEPKVYSAYNRTRERFISTRVDLADLQGESLSQRLADLTPESKKALWLSPFSEVSASRITTPIDLVYLDRNHCVLAVVESFPISRPNSSIWPAATVLALPAHTIASSGTIAGDQLILCSPQKMQLRLSSLFASSAGTHAMPATAIQMMDWKTFAFAAKPLP